jgi:RNA recognition motif-containing protein
MDQVNNKLYVGNLSWSTRVEELSDLFGEVGSVEDAVILTDRETGRSRGFGFVTMSTDEEAQEAINRYNDFEFGGRKLKVNVARPREERPPRRRSYNRY